MRTMMLMPCLLALLVLASNVLTAAQDARPVFDLHIGDGSSWSFKPSNWSESAEGVITPPDVPNLHSRAFYTTRGYKDVVVEFDYNANYRENGHGDAGLILRAQDPNHFYYVHFPWGGQQLRAKHFWVAVAKVTGDGYIRNVSMAYVPGVPSETDRWYHVRVQVEGPRFDISVDGRQALSVVDDGYKNGCVGLAGYGMYSFRNIRISGKPTKPPVWKEQMRIPTHNFTVGFDSLQMPTGCMAPNGDVLLASGKLMIRSTDKGRTWSEPRPVPEFFGLMSDYGNSMFLTRDGRLIVMIYRVKDESTVGTGPEILISESKDNGNTWSEPVASQVTAGWPELPKRLGPYGPLVETEDGTLLRFLLARTGEPVTYTNVVTWGAVRCKAFAIRSTDGGKSWSAPIDLDRPSFYNQPRGTIVGSLDFTEPTGVAIGNKVTVLIRPVYSQTMWQCWSNDAGATWDAAVRATFPGYAQAAIRTRSGVILVAHRYPNYSVNISRDDGLNWDAGTVIDYPTWAMGNMIEVEPDVVLCTYMGSHYTRKDPLLVQLIKVTPDGIEPLPVPGK